MYYKYCYCFSAFGCFCFCCLPFVLWRQTRWVRKERETERLTTATSNKACRDVSPANGSRSVSRASRPVRGVPESVTQIKCPCTVRNSAKTLETDRQPDRDRERDRKSRREAAKLVSAAAQCQLRKKFSHLRRPHLRVTGADAATVDRGMLEMIFYLLLHSKYWPCLAKDSSTSYRLSWVH